MIWIMGIKALEKCSLKKTQLRVGEHLITIFQYLKGSCKENGGWRLFLLEEPHGTVGSRDNRYNLHQESFHLDIRKTFLTVRTIIHWKNLSRTW